MPTMQLELSDELAEAISDRGLLTPVGVTELLREGLLSQAVRHDESVEYPADMDPRLRGTVNPLAFKRGKIVGDVISPLEIEWGNSGTV